MSRIADVLAGAIVRSGIAAMMRATVARRRTSILLYHDPTPEVLDAHLTYLRAHYTPISLDTLVNALRGRTFGQLPPRSVVITIDDGHRRNRDLLDVFRRHEVVPTIYLCSQIVATDRHYWFLDTPDPEPLKALPNNERLATLAEAGFVQDADFPTDTRQALSAAEVAEMRDDITFGGHTRFHPILPMCADHEAEQEIAVCRDEVTALVERPCNHFAYPNGDHSPRDVGAVQQAGYRSARTTATGWVGPHTDPYRLPILGVPDDASVTRVAADLAGVTSWLAHHWTGGLPRLRRRDG